MSGGSRSGRTERAWPNLTKTGPSSSSAVRSRTPSGCRRRPNARSRPSQASGRTDACARRSRRDHASRARAGSSACARAVAAASSHRLRSRRVSRAAARSTSSRSRSTSRRTPAPRAAPAWRGFPPASTPPCSCAARRAARASHEPTPRTTSPSACAGTSPNHFATSSSRSGRASFSSCAYRSATCRSPLQLGVRAFHAADAVGGQQAQQIERRRAQRRRRVRRVVVDAHALAVGVQDDGQPEPLDVHGEARAVQAARAVPARRSTRRYGD